MADCLFCRIVAGEIPATVVRESDRTVSFRDVNPQAPIHVLVIPREHLATVGELARADPDLLGEVMREAEQVARDEGLEDGYRIVFNTGLQGGQMVFHVHAHVIGGRQMGWPPG